MIISMFIKKYCKFHFTAPNFFPVVNLHVKIINKIHAPRNDGVFLWMYYYLKCPALQGVKISSAFVTLIIIQDYNMCCSLKGNSINSLDSLF